MKHCIIGQLDGVVIFVHTYKTKQQRDETYDDFLTKLKDTKHKVYMPWYASCIDNVQKIDCI